MGLSDTRHRAGRLVELRRARLGWLLGLGSGRERVILAMANRHGLFALGHDPGTARHAARLESVVALCHVQSDHSGNVHHPIRRAGISSRI